MWCGVVWCGVVHAAGGGGIYVGLNDATNVEIRFSGVAATGNSAGAGPIKGTLFPLQLVAVFLVWSVHVVRPVCRWRRRWWYVRGV